MVADPRLVFRRGITLLTILCLHLLLVIFWPRPIAQAPLLNVTMMALAPLAMKATAPPALAPRVEEMVRQPSPFVSPRRNEARTAPVDLRDFAPSAAEPEQVNGLADTVRRDLGKVDRDLRKDQRRTEPASAVSPTVRLGRAIAASARPAWGMDEKTFADGRRVTRVRSLLGDYCVITEGAGATDGRDHVPNGNGVTRTNCDHLFE